MKTLQQQKKLNFSTEKIDVVTSRIQATIIPMAEIAAEYRGKKLEPLSEEVFQIELLDGIVKPAIQEGINVTRKELQVAAEVLNTKELIQTKEKLIEQNSTTISNKKSKIVELSQGEQIQVFAKRKQKSKSIRWVEMAFYTIAVIDGLFSYNNFRTAGFPKEVSGVMASFIVVAILIGRILFVPWIQKDVPQKVRQIRTCIAVGLLAIFFFFISYFRTQGASHISIDPSGLEIFQPSPSVWPQFIISYTLFLMVFFLHLFQWKSEDKLKEQKVKLDTENIVATLTEEIHDLNTQNEEARALINERKMQLRHRLDYYHKQVKLLEHIGEIAISRFKRVYTGYVKSIPPFFMTEQKISYDTDLSFYSPEN